MKRKKIVAGNWKMNLLYEEAMSLVAEIVPMVNDEINTETILILIPPFPHIYPIGKLIGKSNQIFLGAQNCDSRRNGAYTGEVSTEILQSYHVKYVLVGHSERRLYFGETNEILAEKLNAVLRADLTPIFCVGEDLQTREAGDFKAVILEQLAQTVFLLEKDAFEQVVIAYEPIWAIGTGKTASSAQAQEVHQFIRSKIAEKYGEATAEQTSILYGGSCKASNAQELFACPDVDGGLIGGASLLSREFVNIAKSF